MIYLPKSQPAPECLEKEKFKASGDYKCGDVIPRLQADFKNKCYLCEEKNPTTINVEHFVPHKGDKHLKFDWNNLFYGCGHCNNTKLAKYTNILDCTKTAEVETKIKYEMKPIPKEKAIITALYDEEKIVSTAKLLDEIYNGTTALKRLESANLRSKLLKEIRYFNDLLFEFENDAYNSQEKEVFRQKIIQNLRSSSSFTAFKRWIIRDNSYFYEEFKDFLEEI